MPNRNLGNRDGRSRPRIRNPVDHRVAIMKENEERMRDNGLTKYNKSRSD